MAVSALLLFAVGALLASATVSWAASVGFAAGFGLRLLFDFALIEGIGK